MAENSKILIVGAGPTGLTAAVELFRRGYHPRIIDEASQPATQSKALAVNPRTLELLEPAGITERLIAAGNRLHRLRAHHEGRRALEVDLSHIPHRFDFMLILPQAGTEKILAGRLEELGGRIEWDTALKDVEIADGKARYLLASPAGEETGEADILLGADGAHSRVRHAAGIGFAGESFPAGFGLADIGFPGGIDPHEARISLRDGSALAFLPFGENKARLIGTCPHILKNAPQEAFLPDFRAEGTEILWESDFKVSFRHVERFQRGPLFLAGDAAHIHSPVGGRGMNLGIEDAAWLAFLIAEGQSEAFTRHRLPVAQRVVGLTRDMTRQILLGGLPATLLRRFLAPALMSVPAIERNALKSIAGLDTPSPPWLDAARDRPVPN
ncbi:FAD-dependent monooxygenase [Afifella sp. IM 167]|uniref:FAD-dependent monooxygenase n=1 Tax=Afifella sp. IM 167 TaxID=2033586 RepID=UPI001CCED963|nr:FAD-dependent monooxygenase [Afifella sp. IM 167]MBZ8135211.1 monooxygenase [Afifella sp. IM 167]